MPRAPTAGSSVWKIGSAKKPMQIQMPQLLAAIVRTSAAGSKVSSLSSAATGALASGMVNYLSPSPLSSTSSIQSLLVVPQFHELKDFVGTTFVGALGAGLAYLRMIEDKFFWHAHYEEALASPLRSTSPQPDFVFVKSGSVAIVESKGTGGTPTHALSVAKDGLVRQVHPALTTLLSTGGYPTEGYAFGTSLGIASTPHAPIQMCSAYYPLRITSHKILAEQSRTQHIEIIKRLNYQNTLRQMGLLKSSDSAPDENRQNSDLSPWEESLDVNRLASGKSDDQLYFGPPIAYVLQDGEMYAAQVAIKFGLLRSLKARTYPNGPEQSDTSPVLGQAPGYWFVNFPDQVRVVFSPYAQKT